MACTQSQKERNSDVRGGVSQAVIGLERERYITPFPESTLFQPPFRRRKDTWCDMTHSVVYYQAWVRWLLCNDIIPKAIPLSERLTQCPPLARHANTDKLIELARIHRL